MSFRWIGTGNSRSVESFRSKLHKRAHALTCACEPLERRWLFATVTWITNGDGDWSVGANWNTGNAPAPGDNVVIDVPGRNVTVTYDAGGTLQLNNLTNNELLLISGANATWTSGTWDGSGTVKIDAASTLAISGSANKIMKDGQTIDNDGMTSLAGTGNIVGQVGAAIINEPLATFNVQSDADITFPAGVGDGIFENGGIFEKTGGGTNPGDMTEIGGPQGFRFENSINNPADPASAIPGDCQIQAGTLALGDNQNTAVTRGGTFEISAGATLNYVQGIANIFVYRPHTGPQVIPSITGPAGSKLIISGGSVQFFGVLAVDEIDVTAGSFLLQQNMNDAVTAQNNTSPDPTPLGTANTLNISGGTFGGSGGGIFSVPSPINHEEEPGLVVADTFAWSGGNLSGAGRTVIDATVTSSTISTASPKAILGGFGLDIMAETIWTGSGTITENGGSVLYIHGGGTLWDQNDGTITQGNADAQGGSIWNSGNFLKNGGTGITTFGVGINFINDVNPLNFATADVPIIQYIDPGSPLFAQLDIRTGTVSLQGSSLNNDDILISSGVTLSYDGGVQQNITYVDSNDAFNPLILGHTGGTINFGNANFTSDLNSEIDVQFATFGTGNYSFDNTAPGAQVFQTVTFNGGLTGTIGGQGTLEVKNSFVWNSGTFLGSGAASSLLIDTGAALTIPSGDRSTSGTYSIFNEGTIAWTTSPGILTIGGSYTQTSTGTLVSNIISAAPNFDRLSVAGTVTLAGNLTVNLGTFIPTDGQKFTLINNTSATAISGVFNGFANGSTITLSGSKFVVSYTGGDGNDMVLTAVVFPVVNVATPTPITEGNTGTKSLIFTVTLSTAVTRAITVDYATSDGTAIAGQDYTAASGTLTILAGRTTGTISVPITGDMLVEPNETFFLSLSNPVNSTLGMLTVATGTILNDDGPPVITFSQPTYDVSDVAGVATITVLNSNSSVPVTVQYSTTPGTAVVGTDYTPVAGTLIFAVGVTAQTFNVPILHNLTAETNVTFTLNLFNAQGGSATVGTTSAVVTVLDTNIPPPKISIADASVTEPIFGQLNAVFTLTVVNPSATPITVDYTTAGGTATSGVDFVATSGTLTFVANQSSALILVPINSDFINEDTETFTLTLSNPSGGAQLDNAVATGTILNQLVNIVTLDAQHPYKFNDAHGNQATILLQGPGTGTISFLGQPIDDSRSILINGTTAQSQLTVRTTKAETFLVDLTVNGPLRGQINGPNLGLLGNLNITGGLQSLHMNSLEGGNAITIGAGSGTFRNLSATLNTVVDSTLTSALPMTLLKVNSWTDTDNGVDITAPSINTLNATGDFSADVSLTGSLGAMHIGRGLSNSIIRVGGNINTVAARTMSDNSIFAGLADTVTTMPTSKSQFINTTSTINNVKVTGKASNSFSNTLIAAPNVGNVQLGLVAPDNGGTPFGVTGETVRAARIRNGRGVRATSASLLNNPFTEIDLQIRLAT